MRLARERVPPHLWGMRRALPILLGSVLAARGLSSGGVTVRNVQHAPLYSPELVRYVGADRDVPPRVVSPGGAGEAGRRTGTVEAALAGIGWLPLDRATATPDGSERGNFHIAVAIDAPVRLDADDAGAGAVGPDDLGPSDGASHVLLAFCDEAEWPLRF